MFTIQSLLQRNKQRGFTLVEMMVVAPMIIIIIGTIIVAIVTLTGGAIAEGGRAQLVYDIQDSLDRIETDVKTSGAYLSTNNFNLSAPQGVDGAVDKFASVNASGQDTFILNSYFTTTNPMAENRSLVYLPNLPYPCGDANIAQNQVMTMNIVYFIKDSTLWRRVVATNNYATKPCSGVTVWQQPNCELSKMSLNPTLCKVEDEKLLAGVEPDDFIVEYFASASDTTPAADTENANANLRQLAIDAAATVQVTIKGNKLIAGRDISQQGTVRVTRTGSIVKYATP